MKMNRLACVALASLCTLYAADAFAGDTVAVMKLDAFGQNADKTAAMVLEAVRNNVMSVDSLILDANGGDITYTEMQMVTGCDRESSIACYDTACETLGAPAIIFGNVKDNGETHLVWYIANQGIHREVTGVVTDPASADKLAKKIVVGAAGSLIVTSNIPGADVFIDGKRVGMSYEYEDSAQPIELVTGNYVIAVRKEGYNNEDARQVTIKEGEATRFHVEMTVAEDPDKIKNGVKIAGYVSTGVGAAALIAGIAIAGVFMGPGGKNDDMNNSIKRGEDRNYKSLNSTGQNMQYWSWGLMIGGSAVLATGVALILTGFFYDFAGENVVEEANANPYMPKIDFNVSPAYQGMNLGWTF